MRPSALLIHVDNVKAGVDWYTKAFPNAKVIYIERFDFTVLEVNGFALEIVKGDEKVGSGKFGTVMYWSVPQLKTAINYFEKIGAKVYRGPMVIEGGLGMCQVEDPFGNLLGLRGKYEQNT